MPTNDKTPGGENDKTPGGENDKTPGGENDKTPGGENDKTPGGENDKTSTTRRQRRKVRSLETEREVDLLALVVAIVFGVLAITMAVATVWFETGATTTGTNETSAGSLAGLLLFGVLTFFFALASLIGVFRALGLQQKDTALGMPQGSIRAFMALVLIMLFFLMAVFLYLDVARTSTDQQLLAQSDAQYQSLLDSGVVTSASPYQAIDPDDSEKTVQLWDVTVRAARERSQVAEDIARQLVTVLGTLIVAIAAFYFGTNSVQAAKTGQGEPGVG